MQAAARAGSGSVASHWFSIGVILGWRARSKTPRRSREFTGLLLSRGNAHEMLRQLDFAGRE